jgi:hypothetical protein
MWTLVSTVLWFVSGFASLLARFPPANVPHEKRYPFVSGSIRGVPARNAMCVATSVRGLHLAMSWMFRPIFFRQIPCIPWAEIRCTQGQGERGGWIPRASRFEIPRIGLRFVLLGEPGREVEEALRRRGST